MYETKNQRPLPPARFAKRLAAHILAASALVILSIVVGMIGYVALEYFSWIDAFLNSAMLLGGMGPVDVPRTMAGKIFAGIYALYAGLMFIVTAALLLTPILHRILHRFHWSNKL